MLCEYYSHIVIVVSLWFFCVLISLQISGNLHLVLELTMHVMLSFSLLFLIVMLRLPLEFLSFLCFHNLVYLESTLCVPKFKFLQRVVL